MSLLVSFPTMLVAFFRYSRAQAFTVLGANRRFVTAMAAGSVAGSLVGGLPLGVVAEAVLAVAGRSAVGVCGESVATPVGHRWAPAMHPCTRVAASCGVRVPPPLHGQYVPVMGWRDIVRGRTSNAVNQPPATVVTTATRSAPSTGQDRWYVPVDGDRERFVDPASGMPLLHLIRHYSGGEDVLRLCEDSTGLLVGPTDRRLAPAGIYVSNLRGENYHKAACRRGDFSPGRRGQAQA